MSRGHHVESSNQVTAITANIARGRDVLAALAAAWSSSANQLDPGTTSDDTPSAAHGHSRSEQTPATPVAQ